MKLRLRKAKLTKLLEKKLQDVAIVALYTKLNYIEEVLDELIDELLERGVIESDPREEAIPIEIGEDGGFYLALGDIPSSKKASGGAETNTTSNPNTDNPTRSSDTTTTNNSS